MTSLSNAASAWPIANIYAIHKIPVHLESKLTKIEDGCIYVRTKDGKEEKIACDSVIVSAGYIPSPLAKEGNKVHLVGDCLSVGNLRSVIWRAYEVAMKI